MFLPPGIRYKRPNRFTPHPAVEIFLIPRYPAPPRSGTIAFFHRRGPVAAPPWFYRTPDEWNTIVERLKRTPCPHCQVVGALIRHGSLYGFDDRKPQGRSLRARRILCSNRNRRPGCGRTFAVWAADTLRRLSVTATTLGRFLQHAVADGSGAARHAFLGLRSERTWLRLWRRFRLGQSAIRAALLGRCGPPARPAAHRPEAQTLAHLQAAFPNDPCPIAAFQHTLRTFFV